MPGCKNRPKPVRKNQYEPEAIPAGKTSLHGQTEKPAHFLYLGKGRLSLTVRLPTPTMRKNKQTPTSTTSSRRSKNNDLLPLIFRRVAPPPPTRSGPALT